MATDKTSLLHGKLVNHGSLVAGEYESPAEYADQGDTRVIRDLMFGYTAIQEDAAGVGQIVATEASRNDEVTLDQIGLLALQKGEANHSFYTTKELEVLRNPSAAAPEGGVTLSNLSEQGEYELAEWLENESPTINDILEAVGDDKDLAHRMLQAENIATDGDPRKGLEVGLTRIIES